MLEKNGQEICVTVWASDIELIKNIGNGFISDNFWPPAPKSYCICLKYVYAGQLPFPISTVPIQILQKMECKYAFTMHKSHKDSLEQQ